MYLYVMLTAYIPIYFASLCLSFGTVCLVSFVFLLRGHFIIIIIYIHNILKEYTHFRCDDHALRVFTSIFIRFIVKCSVRCRIQIRTFDGRIIFFVLDKVIRRFVGNPSIILVEIYHLKPFNR